LHIIIVKELLLEEGGTLIKATDKQLPVKIATKSYSKTGLLADYITITFYKDEHSNLILQRNDSCTQSRIYLGQGFIKENNFVFTVELVLHLLIPLTRYDTLLFHRDSAVAYSRDRLSFALKYLWVLLVVRVELFYFYQQVTY
jgi:hypothetical protein